jgi:hypothetical protein
MVAFAVVRASALGDLGSAGLVVESIAKLNVVCLHGDHGSHRIN